MLRKDTQQGWDVQCEKAFNEMKKQLTQETVLRIFNANNPCVAYCDASNVGIVAVLKQPDDEKKGTPCGLPFTEIAEARTELRNSRARILGHN